ncbi:hypothetical protein HCG51_02010 [Tolypothrix sp. PCC 7910]|uniref:hypothetical protein n=1 Tax=Tolypothrix sp. PCC 7910 TaxID=2099387 RepID=UPI0014276F0C|nr:hypothetical protein [Tolypothrix sp. PCC 7910]QIR35645.1 hypothetical protein HCG51_02010 [Tolypothrix sp. PCC 7910]
MGNALPLQRIYLSPTLFKLVFTAIAFCREGDRIFWSSYTILKQERHRWVGARHPQSFGISNILLVPCPYKEFICRQHYLNWYSPRSHFVEKAIALYTFEAEKAIAFRALVDN